MDQIHEVALLLLLFRVTEECEVVRLQRLETFKIKAVPVFTLVLYRR